MKKLLLCFTMFVMMFGIISCDNDDTIVYTTQDPYLLLEDYDLPSNFAITIQISDTAINNPKDPWYYKTAKLGNDWQLIKYDQDLEDKTKQDTYFYKYISLNSYEEYFYNYDDSKWDKVQYVSFDEMVRNNLNNFIFLYEVPNEEQIEVTETDVTYDTDSTSIENLISATKYSYKDYFNFEVIVDKDYKNMSLSKIEKDGSLVCDYWKAYDYSKTITSWDNTYLTAKNYKVF